MFRSKATNKSLIASVYFVQGVVLMTGLAQFILTRNAFKFSWVQLAFLGALATLTWCIKPLYGFLTDRVPIGNLRRKPYLIISSLLASMGYLILTFWGIGFVPIALAMVILNIGLGFSDVIIDGLVVEIAPPEDVGKYQALCWRAKAFGVLLASLFSGLLIERAIFSSWLGNSLLTKILTKFAPAAFSADLITGVSMLDIRYIFLFTSLWPLIVVFLAWRFDEKPQPLETSEAISPAVLISALAAFGLTVMVVLAGLSPTLWPVGFPRESLSSFATILIWAVWIGYYFRRLVKLGQATKTLFFAALFLFLWRFTPSFGAPWSDYFINTLELSKEKLGYISTLSSLSWIIGSLIYKRFLDSIPVKKVLFWTVIIGVCLSFSQLTIATPTLANALGNLWFIKYSAAVLLYPFYFIGYQSSAWAELMAQPGILNLDAVLSFSLELLFIMSYLPLLKLAALITPKGVEATNFSVLASIMNLGLVFGSISGGWIYTYIEGSYQWFGLSLTGLHLTIIIGALASLICLPLLPWLKAQDLHEH